jgi:16S rRNA (guanine527-N7)-methyltransferase
VAEVAEALGAAVPDAERARAIGVWLDALTAWNAKIDLTAAKDARALVWLMLADAMMLAGAVPSGLEVVDVGTGAGAPGLALAILRPDLRVTICEPLGKRAAFLRTVIGTLGRTDVALRAERADRLPRGAFDVAISRATFPPPEWLALGADLVRPGGSVWVLLAQDDPPADARCAIAETLAYDDASTGAKKRLVRYMREGGSA